LRMHFHVRELDPTAPRWTTCACESFVITTRGPDRKGLVARITAVLAAHNVNVTQLQAAFRGGEEPDRNVMIYEVDIPVDVDQQALKAELGARGRALGLEVNIQHKNIFEAVNRI
jgi:glycine cleavage system transcriptional repressor